VPDRLPARAHDNGIFVLFANGVGEDDGEVRTGNAMILDPYGRVVAESAALEDDIVVAVLDLDLLSMATGRRPGASGDGRPHRRCKARASLAVSRLLASSREPRRPSSQTQVCSACEPMP
jgi:hypothetical protein